MGLLDRMANRLAPSKEVPTRIGPRLQAGRLFTETEYRSGAWRCMVCRQGDDCRERLAAGRTDIPDFCFDYGCQAMQVPKGRIDAGSCASGSTADAPGRAEGTSKDRQVGCRSSDIV